MRYTNVGVMGCGKMAADCTQFLLNHEVDVVFVLETEESPFSSLESICSRNGILHEKTTRSRAAAFLSELDGPVVILSANNDFIFPDHIVRRGHLRIVNFHNALLPSYPGHGQSIPQWIVYNGETRHGVTWHLVNERIDAGHVLCSETFPVSGNDTALSVMMRSMRLGIALFEQYWEQFFDWRYYGMPQCDCTDRIYRSPQQNRLHKKSDIPNNGVLDPSWDFDHCLRFLRSMDYSRVQLIAPPRIAIDEGVYSIRTHRVEEGGVKAKEERDVERGSKTERIYRLQYDRGTITLYLEQ